MSHPASPASGDDPRSAYDELESFAFAGVSAASPFKTSGWGQGADATRQVLQAMRTARQRHPGKNTEDRVIVEELVRALLKASFGDALGDLAHRLSESITESLLDDPEAAARLRMLWDRSGEAL